MKHNVVYLMEIYNMEDRMDNVMKTVQMIKNTIKIIFVQHIVREILIIQMLQQFMKIVQHMFVLFVHQVLHNIVK